MFPIESGQIEAKDRIIPKLPGEAPSLSSFIICVPVTRRRGGADLEEHRTPPSASADDAVCVWLRGLVLRIRIGAGSVTLSVREMLV